MIQFAAAVNAITNDYNNESLIAASGENVYRRETRYRRRGEANSCAMQSEARITPRDCGKHVCTS